MCVCVCVCVVTRPSVCLVGMSCWPSDTEKMVQIIPGEAPSVRHGKDGWRHGSGKREKENARPHPWSLLARLSAGPAKGPGLRE